MIAAIASFFGVIIRVIYDIVNGNYLLAILIFTLLTKLILLPLTIKQIKSTEEMKKITPLDKEIRDKYKNDKQKQSEELSKLYSEHKINPIGGCLPLLIQIPIIFGMFLIVKQPLTYVTQTPKEEIRMYTQEILQKEEVSEREMQENEIVIANHKNIINMRVGNILNLGDVPSDAFSKDESKNVPMLSLSIPILSLILSVVQMKVMQKGQNFTEEQKQMQKTTNLIMPIMSAAIAYTMPLALGVYWLFGNILSIIQQIFINKFIIEKNDKLSLNQGGNK